MKQQTATIELRRLRLKDLQSMNAAMERAYPLSDGMHWTASEIRKLLKIFPEGQLCVTVDSEIAAVALSLIIDYKKFGDNHTYYQITDEDRFNTHDEAGDILYGIEVFVDPRYRGMRLGRRLYDARKELCESLNLRAILAGGRIPNYAQYADELTPRQYIEKVRMKEIYDPTLTFQLSNDFHVRKVLRNYLPEDAQSEQYATLLEWNNIYYEEKEELIKSTKSVVRIGLVQWQMRMFRDFEAVVDQIDYFVDAVSAYHSDFILFPELFNAPLMAEFNHLGEGKAIRGLAQYTQPLVEKFQEMAMAYNVNIVAGSMPVIREDGTLHNVAYLCRRDGTWDSYDKIHVTPSETSSWGITGGDRIKVFDTDCGKIGILICYDVEFPEIARLYADQGMQLLFVPFLTDTQNGYYRVRRCAQARAIENECYVAIAGCVGNLPKVNNMDVQYAQSAIFTPSDFAFPTNAVKAEATPNTEMTVIADVDLELLKELHEYGSVRTLKDRRSDLYQLKLTPEKLAKQRKRKEEALDE